MLLSKSKTSISYALLGYGLATLFTLSAMISAFSMGDVVLGLRMVTVLLALCGLSVLVNMSQRLIGDYTANTQEITPREEPSYQTALEHLQTLTSGDATGAGQMLLLPEEVESVDELIDHRVGVVGRRG